MNIYQIIGMMSLPITVMNIPTAPAPVDFTQLKAQGIRNINFGYFDFKGKVPDSKFVEWKEALEDVWDRKLNIKNVSGASKKLAPVLIDEYIESEPEKMTVSQHIDEVDEDLSKVKIDLDWGKICIDYKLTNMQCSAFVETAYKIDGRMLTAYSMTELMPYRKGNQNLAAMEIYMQNAGRNYLDVIPSLYDKLLSIGRYQFTSYALGNDSEGPRAANQIAAYSANYNIPSSVSKVSGIESDRAAYYFSVYNLIMLFRNLDDEKIVNFENSCKDRRGEVLEYIASAHHLPRYARENVEKWIGFGCSKPLKNYQGKALKIYSQKTSTNYNAVMENI